MLGTNGIVILASILVVYLIMPIVSLFRKRMPLTLALLLTYVLLAVVLVLAFVAIVPPLLTQARSLIAALPPMLASLQRELSNPHSTLVKDIPPNLRGYLNALPAQMSAIAAKYGLGVAQATVGAFFSIVTLFMSIIVVPIFSAYVFYDVPEIKAGFIGMIPEAARPRTLAILADLNSTIGDFVRGQVLDGLILGTLIAVMLGIMHVPYALLIGVSAGILNLIPYLGAIIGFIPSVLLAGIFNGWENALIVAILFGVIQQLDGNFIMPRIMKSSVRLSPLVIIAAILVFSAFFGIVGTFLAVPLAAMLRVLKLHLAPAVSLSELNAEEKQAAPLELIHASTAPDSAAAAAADTH
jgi:predicted PurR-regulated permease PerM